MGFFSNLSLKSKSILLIANSLLIIPGAIATTLFAVYDYFGVDKVFNATLERNIQETVKIAKLHRDETIKSIQVDLLMIAESIDADLGRFIIMNEHYDARLINELSERFNLPEIVCFTKDAVIAKTTLPLIIPHELFMQAHDMSLKHINIQHDVVGDKVRVIIKLRNILNAEPIPTQEMYRGLVLRDFLDARRDIYLMASRYIDPDITQYLARSQESASSYMKIQEQHTLRKKILIAFGCVFGFLLILAILIVRKMVTLVVTPIDQTIDVIQKIKKGDLDIHITESGSYEMQIVMQSLNEMAAKIFSQQNKIVDLNHAQRKMIESLNLSTGMLLINGKGTVIIANLSASKILEQEKLNGQLISVAFPEIQTIFERCIKLLHEKQSNILIEDAKDLYDISYNIEITRNGKKKMCEVYLTEFEIDDVRSDTDVNMQKSKEKKNGSTAIEYSANPSEYHGCILITFDDITAIISAHQLRVREDIARKVAHEVRNPLSPIQLAIERLEDKFLPQIHKDRDVFMRYTSTISNRVSDIKRIIDDFVEFGQLAKPIKSQNDLIAIIEEVLLLQQNMYHRIKYKIESDTSSCIALCDRTQIAQAITNILKNAAESIYEKGREVGHVVVKVVKGSNLSLTPLTQSEHNPEKIKELIYIIVFDNGKGFFSKKKQTFEYNAKNDNDNNAKEQSTKYHTASSTIDAGINDNNSMNNASMNNMQKQSGMGVGLKIVDKIALEHGGRFEILGFDALEEVLMQEKMTATNCDKNVANTMTGGHALNIQSIIKANFIDDNNLAKRSSNAQLLSEWRDAFVRELKISAAVSNISSNISGAIAIFALER